MNKLTAASIILTLLATPSLGATVTPDISNLGGFERLGASGTGGNGYLWVSPKYFFEPGTTIDFGTAFVIGDPTDHRQPCGDAHQPSCFASRGAFTWYFLTDGEGGIPPSTFDLGHGFCMTTTDYCAPDVFRLLFTLGPANNGIQLAFQGDSLRITSVPLPATWLLFLAGFALAGCKINVGSRSIVVDRPQKM
jgi:hypothetical protein